MQKPKNQRRSEKTFVCVGWDDQPAGQAGLLQTDSCHAARHQTINSDKLVGLHVDCAPAPGCGGQTTPTYYQTYLGMKITLSTLTLTYSSGRARLVRFEYCEVIIISILKRTEAKAAVSPVQALSRRVGLLGGATQF